MKSILKFFGLGREKYPKISYMVRGEGISYILPDKKISIGTTFIGGERLYLDSLDKWEGKGKLTPEEKSQVFSNTISYMRKSNWKKIIVVINIDFDREFWESECEKVKKNIKFIEYTSDKEKDDTLYKMFSELIPKLIIDGQKFERKEEFDKYWTSRKK